MRVTLSRIVAALSLTAIALVTDAAGQARPGAEPRKDIADALAAAKQDGKPVLLDFGAAWCVDCRVLWKALEDQAVAQFVKAHFHLVEIDTGQYFVGPDSPEPKNIDIAKTYGVDLRNEGIPTLIPLTPEAKTIPTDRHVKWSNARNFSVADVLAYLKEMAKLANAKPARG